MTLDALEVQAKSDAQSLRKVCEKIFTKYLKPTPNRPNCYFQAGQTQVMIESRQWKLAYSPLEKVTYDLSDESAIVLEIPSEGIHLVPWNVVLRVSVNQGGHLQEEPKPASRW